VHSTLSNADEERWSYLRNFHCFLGFYRNHFEGCREFYAEVSDQVSRMVSKIQDTVKEAEDRVADLAVQKEVNKEKAAEQGELHRGNHGLKKEVEELDAVIEQHLKTVLEDKMTIARSKLMVGQEMATNYHLYQNLMDDLQATLQPRLQETCVSDELHVSVNPEDSAKTN
jgi:sarcosine oxidase delta subunit